MKVGGAEAGGRVWEAQREPQHPSLLGWAAGIPQEAGMGLSFGPLVSLEAHRTKGRMAGTLIHQITPSQLAEQVPRSAYSPVPGTAL